MSKKEAPFIVRPLSEVLKEHPDFSPAWRKGKRDSVLSNPNFGEIRHIVVCDRKTGKPLWDQPVYTEPVGVITVPVTKDEKIRLQRQYRPIAMPPGLRVSFPEITPERTWGRWFWDIPRGLSIRGELPQETAIRETREETQSSVLEIVELGEINADSSFFNQMISVFVAYVGERREGEVNRDENEAIIKGGDFTVEVVKSFIAEGEIQSALSLAALNLYFQRIRR